MLDSNKLRTTLVLCLIAATSVLAGFGDTLKVRQKTMVVDSLGVKLAEVDSVRIVRSGSSQHVILKLNNQGRLLLPNNSRLTTPFLDRADINTPDIDGGTIDGSTIGTADINTPDIDGGTIDGSTIGTADINTPDIDGGTIDGSTIGTADINTPDIDGGTIDGSTIGTADINTPDIDGGTIDGSTIGTSKLTSPDINTPDIDGGTIDGSTIGTADINTPDIDGGTIDGSTIGTSKLTSPDINTPDIDGGTIDGSTVRPGTIRLPRSATNPSSANEGDSYWNTDVDSLRIYDGSGWRNIGQRGQGYYEITTYDNPFIRWNGSAWELSSDGAAGAHCMAASTDATYATMLAAATMSRAQLADYGTVEFFCKNIVNEHITISSASLAMNSPSTVIGWRSTILSSTARLFSGSSDRNARSNLLLALSPNNLPHPSGLFIRGAFTTRAFSQIKCATLYGQGV